MTLEDITLALALTASVALLTAAVIGTHAASGGWRTADRERPMAWTAFATSMALFVAAIWMGVAA
jgi:hypothetical protein